MIRLRDRFRYWLEDQIKKRVTCKSHYERTSGPIHTWFSLSYASYYVVPRLALQEMPVWWQHCFLFLVNMLPETPGYTCQRRDAKGHFIKDDPWARYRRGTVAEAQCCQQIGGCGACDLCRKIVVKYEDLPIYKTEGENNG